MSRSMVGVLAAAVLLLAGCGGGAAAPRAAAPATSKGAPSGSASSSAVPAPSSPSAPASGSASGSVPSIVIPYTAVTAAQAWLWIAVDKNLFKPFGLNVKTTSVSNGAIGIQSMLGGSFPMIPNDGISTTAASVSSDVVWIATFMDKLDGALVTRPQVSAVDQMAGKTLLVTGVGNLSGFEAQEFLQHYKLTGKVKLATVGSLPAELAALKSGHGDAAILSDPILSAARNMGMHQLVDLWTTITEPLPVVGLVSTRSYVTAHPDIVAHAIEGLWAAVAFMKAHPNQSMAVIAKYTKIKDQAILKETYSSFVNDFFAKNPVPVPSSEQSIIKFLCPIRKNVCGLSPSRVIDASVVTQLQQSGALAKAAAA